MPAPLVLADPRALDDLATLLGRGEPLVEPAVRLQGHGDVVLVTLAAMAPATILDAGPTVLATRGFRARDAAFDAVVPIADLRDAVAGAIRDGATIELPDRARIVPAWAAVSPPRGGWTLVDTIAAGRLADRGRVAVDRLRAIPAGTGEARVLAQRREIYAERTDLGDASVGAAVAAHLLGFLPDPDAEVRVLAAGPWTRVQTGRGDVLARD